MEAPHRGLHANEIVIGIATIVLALIFGFALSSWLKTLTLGGFLTLAMVSVLWLSAQLIFYFLTQSLQLVMWICVLECAALWATLSEKASLMILFSLFVLFVVFTIEFTRTKRYLENALEIKFFRIGMRIIPGIMTGVSLFLALYLVGVLLISGLTIPKETFTYFLNGVEPMVERFVPGFALQDSVDEVLRSVISAQAKEASSQEIEEAIEKVKQDINEATDIRLTGKEKFLDAVHSGVVGKLTSLPPAHKSITLIIIGFAVFSAVKAVAYFLNWIIVAVAYLMYRTLFVFKVISIEYVPREKQEIIIS